MQKVTKITGCFVFTLVFLFIACSEKDIPTYGSTSEFNDRGIKEDMLDQAFTTLSQVDGMQSILLGRNGVVEYERYYNDGNRGTFYDVRSVTKSVMGLLIGIAIEEGFIQSIQQTVGEFFVPGVIATLDADKAAITIEDLLTMSCGLEWHELDGGDSYSQWYWSGDHVGWVLNQAFIHTPGQGFNYNTGSTHLLSEILTIASGMETLDFASQYLFQPMGIGEAEWDRVPQGNYNGGAGLTIKPHDMFAVGNLMLNNGAFGDTQIIPTAWVSQSITNQQATNRPSPYGTHYGYLWWLDNVNDHDIFYAMGWGGQFIVCVPDLDMVVCATCTWSGFSAAAAGEHWVSIIDTIMGFIIPAVRAQ